MRLWYAWHTNLLRSVAKTELAELLIKLNCDHISQILLKHVHTGCEITYKRMDMYRNSIAHHTTPHHTQNITYYSKKRAVKLWPSIHWYVNIQVMIHLKQGYIFELYDRRNHNYHIWQESHDSIVIKHSPHVIFIQVP